MASVVGLDAAMLEVRIVAEKHATDRLYGQEVSGVSRETLTVTGWDANFFEMKTNSPLDLIYRREFLKRSILGGASFATAWPVLGGEGGSKTGSSRPLRFGIITDVHKDVMHDADDRLRVFIQQMERCLLYTSDAADE